MEVHQRYLLRLFEIVSHLMRSGALSAHDGSILLESLFHFQGDLRQLLYQFTYVHTDIAWHSLTCRAFFVFLD